MKRIFTPLFAVVVTLFLSTSLMAQTPGSASALQMDGSTNYVDCGTIDMSGVEFTLSAWVKVDAFKTAFPFITSIIGIEQGGNTALLRFGDASLASNRLQFVIGNAPTQVKLDGIQTLNVNEWYHVAATFDGSEMRIYINGELDASMPNAMFSSANDAFALGRNYDNARILDGTMDEARLWFVGLDQPTIRDWMCKKVTASHPNYSALGGYWRMDDGAGTTATDLSGSGNNGTLTSSPLWVTSGAPIGDESAHQYTGPFNVSLSGPGGSMMTVSNLTGTPDGVHVYRVDDAPNNTTPPAGVSSMQMDHYWGVFVAGGTNPNFDADYNYLGNNFFTLTNGCKATLIERNNNASALWATSSVTNVAAATTLETAGQTRIEYAMALADTSSLALSGAPLICAGDTVTLSTGIPQSLGVTYAWFNGGTAIPGAGNTDYGATTDGSYSATVTTATGCVLNFFPVAISTSPGPITLSTFSDVCEEGIPFPLSGGAPAFGFYQINGVNNISFNPAAVGPGTHSIAYVVVDINTGCIDSAVQSVEVYPTPIVGFGLDTGVCLDAAEFGLVSGTPVGGVYAGPGITGNDFDAATAGPGIHAISYTYTDGQGCSADASGQVQVFLLPATPVITLVMDSLTTTTSVGYQWSDANGPIVGATNKSYKPTADGEHTVQVTDGNGCVSAPSEPFTYTLIGVNDVVAAAGTRLYPNPTTGEFFLEYNFLGATNVRVSLLNILGQPIAQLHQGNLIGQGTLAFNEAGLQVGIYFVKIESNEGVVSQKIVVQ